MPWLANAEVEGPKARDWLGAPVQRTAKQSARDRSNRIVSVVADNAKNLTAQEDLIDFAALDREQLPQWIENLEEAR